MIDAAALLRTAAALGETAAAMIRLAPAISADYSVAADVLKIAAAGLQGLPILAPPAPPTPASRPPRLARHAQMQRATSWFFDRREAFTGKLAPVEEQDIADARAEIPGVSRDAIRRCRPVEWKLRRGERPQQSPKT